LTDEFENDPIQGEAAPTGSAPEVDPLADFLNASAEVADMPVGATTITVRTSGGQPRYVPTNVPMTPRDLLGAAGIFVTGVVEYWLDGAKIGLDDIVPVNGTLTIVGSVKGGAL
jgi:hypothetical protein